MADVLKSYGYATPDPSITIKSISPTKAFIFFESPPLFVTSQPSHAAILNADNKSDPITFVPTFI
jgi:hypothetical protein